jgi:hypothetical protein
MPAAFGGLAGSLLTFVVSSRREAQRERKLRSRIYSQVRYELMIFEVYLDRVIRSNAIEYIPLTIAHNDFLEGEKIRASFEYPKMPIELKLRAFDVDVLAMIQDVYRQIDSIELLRTVWVENGSVIFGNKAETFVYKKSDLQELVAKIDQVQQTITESHLELLGFSAVKRIRFSRR